MKIFIKVICSIIIIPVLLIVFISGTFKFQLLNTDFWINSFNKDNVYQKIQNEIFIYLENKNAKMITNLVTHENVKDFTDKNIDHVIGFLNGKSKELTFYIPVKKIPAELLPKKLGTITTEMTAKELIQKFNIAGINPVIFDQFKITGKVINYIFYFSFGLSIILAIFAYPPVLTFFGVITTLQVFFIKNINIHSNKIIEIMLTPVISEISSSWSYLGIALIVMSISILLVQKFVGKRKNG